MLTFAFKDLVQGIFSSPKSFLSNVFSGAIAGALALSVVHPLKMATTRLHADLGVDSSTERPREFNTLRDVFRKIVAEDGVMGLYRGFTLAVGGIILYRGAYFGLFDTGKAVLFPDVKNANALELFLFA